MFENDLSRYHIGLIIRQTWYTLSMATGGIANVLHSGQSCTIITALRLHLSAWSCHSETTTHNFHSATPLHWSLHHRPYFLLYKHCDIHLGHNRHVPPLVLLAGCLPCLILSSYRVSVHTSQRDSNRYYFGYHYTIRSCPWQDWSMVTRRHGHNLLDLYGISYNI